MFVENCDKDSKIRYLQAEEQPTEVLMLPVADYKKLIKQTHKDRPLVQFLCKT